MQITEYDNRNTFNQGNGSDDEIRWADFDDNLATPKSYSSVKRNIAWNVFSLHTVVKMKQGITWSGNFADGADVLYARNYKKAGPTPIFIKFMTPVFGVGAQI